MNSSITYHQVESISLAPVEEKAGHDGMPPYAVRQLTIRCNGATIQLWVFGKDAAALTMPEENFVMARREEYADTLPVEEPAVF